jgi:hypothetical protein
MVAVFLAIAGLAIAGGIYFATRGHDAPTPVPSAVSATPSAIPTTTTTGTQVIVGGVNGADPFWTPAEVLGVAEANRGALAKCAEEALAVDKSLAKTFSTIVTPKEDGPVESVMCNAESDGPGEGALCGCVQRVIGGWRFPKAHGRVGLLTSGPLTYEFRIVAP